MKRYWLFGGCVFYAKGGIHDFIDSSDNTKEIWQIIKQKFSPDDEYSWFHIVDSKTGKIVARSEVQGHSVDESEVEGEVWF